MKTCALFIMLVLLISGCLQNKKSHLINKVNTDTEKKSYFPVTSFLKGEIISIKQSGINPIKIIYKNGIPDTTWLKLEDLEREFSPFLNPVIDSNNLISWFKENAFFDQTLGTYTFMYEPYTSLPDSMTLRRYDVYLNAETNKVKRIYIEKEQGQSMQQLTWLAGKWARILMLTSKNNKEIQQEEINIIWNFTE